MNCACLNRSFSRDRTLRGLASVAALLGWHYQRPDHGAAALHGRKRRAAAAAFLASFLVCTATLCGQAPSAAPQPQHPPAAEQAPEKGGEQPAEQKPADTRRLELNLLGKTDTASGESRRNENIQFNLVDNNALKELNIRLGTTATVVQEFLPGRSYFGAEFGNPPAGPIHLAAPAKAYRRGAGLLGRDAHGTFYETHQNSVFSARSFFQVGGVKPAHENDYGFTFGLAPWRKANLMLDGSQQKLRGSVNGNVLVPREDERTPLATDPAIRAIITRFLAAYPSELPNRPDVNPRALNTNSPQNINGNNGSVRLDQNRSEGERFTVFYQFTSQSVKAFQLVSGQNPDTDTKSHRARLTWSRAWGPKMVSDFTAGFERIGSLLRPEKNAVGPMVSITGLETLGPQAIIPIDRAQNIFRYAGQVRGSSTRHNWTAGFGVLRRQLNGTETDAHRGFFAFSNDFGNTGITNFRLGLPAQHIIAIGDVHRRFRSWDMQFYAGDSWRLSPNLTLNAGLRYEPYSTPYEVNHLNEVPYGCGCRDFAPQFGFAYRLPERWGTVRSSYGLHYGQIFPVTFQQVRFSPPGSVKIVVTAPNLADPLHGIAEGGAVPNARGNLYLLDPELRTPYSHQYNFMWEPALAGSWRLQLAYAGSRSHRLLTMWYLNRAHPSPLYPQTTKTINERRPNQKYADIRWVLNGSRGYYDAARVTLAVPRRRGLAVDASYWFSKAMDLGSSYTNTAYDADSRLSRSQSEFESQRDMKARSTFDQPHAFLVHTSYAVPRARWTAPSARWLAVLAGGWNVSAIALLKQGTPFGIVTPDGPGYGNVDGNGGDRPNLLDPSILGRTAGDPDTSRLLLPRAAFAYMLPTDERGNLGRNVFRKGGIRNVNAAMSRAWPIRNGKNLMFRAESVNLLNTPQFAEPGTDLSSPNFAQITNTLNDGRAFRFTLQFGW